MPEPLEEVVVGAAEELLLELVSEVGIENELLDDDELDEMIDGIEKELLLDDELEVKMDGTEKELLEDELEVKIDGIEKELLGRCA